VNTAINQKVCRDTETKIKFSEADIFEYKGNRVINGLIRKEMYK